LKLAITAALALTEHAEIENPLILVEDGRISRLTSRLEDEVPRGARHLDHAGAVLAPGLVDIHIHGSAGHDVMEATGPALAAVETFLARHGVTSYLPTTVTASVDKTLAALEHLGAAVRGPAQKGRAQARGIHLEGPFISTAKCGVHPVHEIIAPSLELFEKMWAASQQSVSMVTLAPELPGAEAFTRELARRGVRISLGHSNALAAETQRAIEAGATHATHTFNAMRALDHREPGILGTVLADDRVSADIIADGIHVAPEMVRLFLRSKGSGAVLITDAISATGMPDGKYRLGTFEVEVQGERCLLDGRLAGSVLTLDRAVRNAMRFASLPLTGALSLATKNAAHAGGLDCGVLREGGEADMVVLSAAGDVVQTYVRGEAAIA